MKEITGGLLITTDDELKPVISIDGHEFRLTLSEFYDLYDVIESITQMLPDETDDPGEESE